MRELDILPAGERRLLLEEWNATEAPYPDQLCIHQLFEEQVARAPEAVALVFEDEALSYGELNAHSNRLAHHLIALGVRPDDRVAICVERSFEMVVGLLAILKAGGAYVPLDPAYPAERLGFMLADAEPRVVLTHGPAREALDAALPKDDGAPQVIDLIEDQPAWAALPGLNLEQEDQRWGVEAARERKRAASPETHSNAPAAIGPAPGQPVDVKKPQPTTP